MPLPLVWIDTHCHFDFAVFAKTRQQQWQLAQALGVKRLLIPGVSQQQGRSLAQLCENNPWLYAQGLHPYFLAEHSTEALCWLEQQLQQDPKVVAVGEIGLDSVLADSNPDASLMQQHHYFSAQVALAKQYKKPIILHIRGQHDQAASYLASQQITQGGIVHAFSGSEQQGKRWLDLGFKLGIGGAMTHPRAHKLRRTIAALPSDAWLLETDSPDMRSAFWRGPLHSPAAIPLLAACLAAIKKIPLVHLAEIQQCSFREGRFV